MKKSKKTSKSKLSILYEKTKNRKLQEVRDVNSNIIFKARVGNLIKSYPKLIPIILILIAVILVITFHSNMRLLSLVLLMYVLILMFSIYCNTFTISCKNNNMSIKTNMQEIIIAYKDLKNVFIDKKYERIFIKKREYFRLIILYKAPNGNISNVELPILFVNQKDLEKFLNNFELMPEKNVKNLERAREYKLKRLLIKAGLFILIWILILITLIAF